MFSDIAESSYWYNVYNVLYVVGMRLCVPRGMNRAYDPCVDTNCPKMHLCRDYVAGFCAQGVQCTRSHTFQVRSVRAHTHFRSGVYALTHISGQECTHSHTFQVRSVRAHTHFRSGFCTLLPRLLDLTDAH